MTCDYFVAIDNKLRPLLKEIDDLDKNIAEKKVQINNLKRTKSNSSSVENEKRELEKQRKKKWEMAYNLTPYFSSHWKALSSLYLAENDSPIAKLVRDRYVELQYREGSQRINKEIENNHLTKFLETFKIPKTDISLFPPYSFFLQFSFKLASPFISKDDEEFYIIDNPVRKDKVFKVPMVSGSTWKGNLRWTAGHIAGSAYTKEIRDLFGNEKDEGKDFRRGRLNFYPTFFDQISLEVINPHDRKTKAGTQPIYIESVPEGASGTFSLLYVPFDLMGKRQDEVKAEVKKDMEIVSDSLEKMMRTYGFSAKKGSGFGVVKEEIKGRFNDKEFSGFKGLKKMMEETHNDR